MNSFPENLTSYAKAVGSGIKDIRHLSLSTLRKVFSLLGKREKIALVVLFSAAVLSLFFSLTNFYYNNTKAAPDFGGKITEGLLGQPTYINPLLARQEPDISVTKLVFSGLYKYSSEGQLIPDLAEGMPTVSDDQKQYTVNLKKNAKWQNDKALNADDIIFTIDTLKDPAFKSPLRPMWQATSVEKLSDYSVKFTTKDISGPFLDNLTLPILPKSVWSKVDSQNFLLAKFNLEAMGSGPYAIKEIKKLPSGKVEEISLVANQNFYLGKPNIEFITLKFYDSEDDLLNAFHSREISSFGFIPLGSNLYLDKEKQGGQILSIPLPQYQVVFFNLNNKILTDIKVRKALSLATDKEQIVSQIFKNNALLPGSPLLFSTQQAPDQTKPEKNLDQAKALLDEAGWKIDTKSNVRTSKKGTAFEISLITNDSLVNSKAAQVLAEQWRELNIKVNLSVLPSKQLTDTVIKPRTFDVLLFPQKFGADPDPFLFWHSSQVKDPGYNLTGFADQSADKLIIEARTTTDKQTREQDYQQFSQLIAEKVPVIFLDQTEFIYALDNKIKNVNLKVLYDPSHRFYDVSNWHVTEKRIWK